MLVHHGVPLFHYGHTQPKIAGSLGQIKSKVNLGCLTEEDAGVYECVISNGQEKKSATTELRVASKLFHFQSLFVLSFKCKIRNLLLRS